MLESGNAFGWFKEAVNERFPVVPSPGRTAGNFVVIRRSRDDINEILHGVDV